MKATPIALLLAGVLASPLCAAGLDARLTLVEGSTDDVRVNLTLTNTGEKPVRLLKWQLPGSEDAPLFQVERDGQPVDYEGALIKRAAPSDKDYQLLKAGQSLTVQAEVSGLYDMSAQGQYSIRYLLPTVAQEGKAAKAKQAQASESNAVTLWVDGVSDDRVLAKAAVTDRIEKFLSINGERSVDSFHRELGHIMWEYCGMERTDEGLRKAIGLIRDLKQEFWTNVRVLGEADTLNQSLEKAGRVADLIELGELMCIDALHRRESCGGHFRAESQTEDGEALRHDDEFAYVAAWEFTGGERPTDMGAPVLHKEDLVYEFVEMKQRSYK